MTRRELLRKIPPMIVSEMLASIGSAAAIERNVKHAHTPFGEIAYTDRGKGPPALFVHGVFLNGYLWRHVVDRVADLRRTITVDLMAHGATKISADQDVSFAAQAEMLEALCAKRRGIPNASAR